LRILRALRFASVYDLQLDPDTLDAALEMCDTLSNVSAERIFVELKKLLCGKAARRILLEAPKVLFAILPELSPMYCCAQNNPHHAYDVWTHTAISVENAPADAVYRLTMLFHDSGKPRAHTVDQDGIDHFKLHQLYSAEIAEECLLRLKSDTATLRQVLFLVKEHDLRIPATVKAVKKQMLRLGQSEFMSLFPVFRADLLAQNPALIPEKQAHVDELYRISQNIAAQNACVSLKQLAVNGSMLKPLGISGKQTGEVLKRLLEAVALSDYPNEPEALLRLASSLQNHSENAD
ncbi:MAG: HD domain-containing protein, partial [Clostridia bacterium]|nr:HD domain-containing protein [Clostridia bacterium]